MKKITIFALTTALLAFSLTATPAFAGWKEKCAADIKLVEEELGFKAQGWKNRDVVEDKIKLAQSALKKGKKKKCKKVMDFAKSKFPTLR